jgi:hypothetical protein
LNSDWGILVRRATAALLGTVTGTVLLVGLKYGTSPGHTNANNTAALVDPSGAGTADPGAAGSASGPAGAPSGLAAPAGPGAASVPADPPASRPNPGRSAASSKPAPPGPPPPAPPACTTTAGDPSNVSRPGVGAVTVTIKVCGGAISTASGSLSQSNWSRNTNAVPALNTLAVKYYKTDFAQIHYSGATLTSNAYQASLRSAMSRANL